MLRDCTERRAVLGSEETGISRWNDDAEGTEAVSAALDHWDSSCSFGCLAVGIPIFLDDVKHGSSYNSIAELGILIGRPWWRENTGSNSRARR